MYYCNMKEDTRRHIIQTASYLFYTKGYNLTGINEIIAEADIAKATLYSHFKSKEDICVAYLQFMNQQFLDDIKNYCLQKPQGVEQILAIMDFLADFYTTKEFNGCWCINTVAEIPSESVAIKAEIQTQKKLFLSLIEDLVASNLEVSKKETQTISKQVYLLYEGAVTESHLHNSEWPIEEAKSICESIIV